MLILDYSHHLYEPEATSPHPISGKTHRSTASPQHPESVAAFARWAAASARHFHGRQVIWEIWNEPNGNFWSPKPDAPQYTTLALAACKAMREAEPQATIIGPATSGFPWDFLETFLKSGVLEYLDGVSVHPYREQSRPPETAAGDYQRLRKLIDRYAPATRARIEILSGEWGYSSKEHGVPLEVQAAFAVRQQLANLLSGVPLSIWYDWKNDGPDPGENEHNFGTVLSDLKPKPAYIALKTMTRELAGCRLTRRIELPSPEDYGLLFAAASGAQKIAAWTVSKPHSVKLDAKFYGQKNLADVTGDGGSFNARIESGELVLDLSSAPRYLILPEAILK